MADEPECVSIEPEYVSIHDRLTEKAVKEINEAFGIPRAREIPEKQIPLATELEDIRKSQRYILDKLSSMDRFLRSSQYRYSGRVMDGEAYESEVIEKFLERARDHTHSQKEMELIQKFLGVATKNKEIE